MVRLRDIEGVATRIGEAVDAERVILFGSYARGKPSETSDVDLMIIAESDLPRFKRTRDLYKMFQPYPFGMDLIMYTPGEVERARRCALSFVSTVLREGKTVYVRRDGNSEAVGSQSGQ